MIAVLVMKGIGIFSAAYALFVITCVIFKKKIHTWKSDGCFQKQSLRCKRISSVGITGCEVRATYPFLVVTCAIFKKKNHTWKSDGCSRQLCKQSLKDSKGLTVGVAGC